MNILSEAPLKKWVWDGNSYNDLLRKSPEHSKINGMWTLLFHILNLILQKSSWLCITSPSHWWRKRVRLTHHRCKAAYLVTKVYRGSVGLQQKQEKVAAIQGHSHWLCVHLRVPVQGCWAFGHLLSPKSANSFEWIPLSFEVLYLFFPTGITLLLHVW